MSAASAIATACVCKYIAPAGLSPMSAEFHIQHRAHHMRTFPNAGHETFANLNDLVDRFKRREEFLATKSAQEATPAPIKPPSIDVIDAQAIVETALQRMYVVLETATQVCKGELHDVGAVLCGALATLALNHPDTQAILDIAIASLQAAKRAAAAPTGTVIKTGVRASS